MKRRILKWLCVLCWKIGDYGGVLWEAYYFGSDEETRDAIELNFGDDLDFYTARQQEIIRRRAEWEELA
jgi:hypothetical protein